MRGFPDGDWRDGDGNGHGVSGFGGREGSNMGDGNVQCLLARRVDGDGGFSPVLEDKTGDGPT